MTTLEKLIEETGKLNADRLEQWIVGILSDYLTPAQLKTIAGHRRKGDAKSSIKLLKKKRIYMENIHDEQTGFRFFMIRKGQKTVGFKKF